MLDIYVSVVSNIVLCAHLFDACMISHGILMGFSY